MKIDVEFIIEDEGIGATQSCVRRYDATNAGHAFQKCLKEYPKARLIKGWKEGGYQDGWGITTYEPPSTVTIEAKPGTTFEQMGLDL
jgi:hypothetical protein